MQVVWLHPAGQSLRFTDPRVDGRVLLQSKAVQVTAVDTSTNLVYLSERMHEELLSACSWVAPVN